MQTTVTPEALSRWNGEISAEIRERYGLVIDRTEEPARVWIHAEVLRTTEDFLTAAEIANALKALLVDQANRRVSGAGTGTMAN